MNHLNNILKQYGHLSINKMFTFYPYGAYIYRWKHTDQRKQLTKYVNYI